MADRLQFSLKSLFLAVFVAALLSVGISLLARSSHEQVVKFLTDFSGLLCFVQPL